MTLPTIEQQRNILLIGGIAVFITAILDVTIIKTHTISEYVALNFIEIGMFCLGWIAGWGYKQLNGEKVGI